MGPRCPLCWPRLAARFFEEKGRASTACDQCDRRFLDPVRRLAADQERSRYLQHVNEVSDPRYWAFVTPLFDHMVDGVPRRAAGLGIGAGPGPVLSETLLEAGYQIHLFDPFFHPAGEHLDRRYDSIVADEVVEQLFNSREELHALKELLSDGGIQGP